MNSRYQCRDEAQGLPIVCAIPLHKHPISLSQVPKIFKVELKKKVSIQFKIVEVQS